MSEYHFTVDDVVPSMRLGGQVVELDEARRRLGRTVGVDEELWLWTPGQIRWLTGHWTIFRRELALCEEFADDLERLATDGRPMWYHVAMTIRSVFQTFADSLRWYLTEAPIQLRLLTGLAMLTAYTFAVGWF